MNLLKLAVNRAFRAVLSIDQLGLCYLVGKIIQFQAQLVVH